MILAYLSVNLIFWSCCVFLWTFVYLRAILTQNTSLARVARFLWLLFFFSLPNVFGWFCQILPNGITLLSGGILITNFLLHIFFSPNNFSVKKIISFQGIQCVSVDSASLIIYPEIKATEVRFSALKRYLCSFYFRIDNETGRIQWNTLYIISPVSYLSKKIQSSCPSQICQLCH